MPASRLFDANCVVGRHLVLGPGGPHTAADLLADMDRHGIAEALVIDSLARECHPAPGNKRILEVAAASPRLHPAWAALPPGTEDEQPPPADLVALMRKNGVGAIFLYPGQYKFGLGDWCVDALVEPLAEVGVPVFINPNDVGAGLPMRDQTDWAGVVALCRRWPSLPVVVSEWRIRRSQREIYRALDACPNLRIELSGYWLYRGVEYITSRWGAERLLFGSNWPTFNHALTLAAVTMADVSDDDKRLILGDNLRRLLAWAEVERPEVEPVEPADEFVRFVRTGERPPDMSFLDAHGHLGGCMSHYHVPGGSVDETVCEMDRLGVEKTCVFSFAGVVSDEAYGNDVVADACRRYPERFVGFTLVNLLRGREAVLAELERGARMGLRGVKLIGAYHGYPPEHPLTDNVCRWANDRRAIVLNHNWGSPDGMERLLRTCPDACFITGHSTTAYAESMRRHSNLYVCTCPLLGSRTCEEFVERLGADRLVFGSDLQDLPVSWGLGPVLAARISPAEKRLILGENLRRILERYSLKP